VSYLEGLPMNYDTKGRAKRIADAYVDKVKKIFGIDMVPILVWDEDEQRIEIGAEPASDLDEALVARIIERETQQAA
jgi:hypothetical protein